MQMMDTLADQAIHGMYARDALRDAENMMARIAQWDLLFADEREREWEKGALSPFFEVPGFQPRWCANCRADQWFDYKEDPEGACMTCGAWGGQETKEAA